MQIRMGLFVSAALVAATVATAASSDVDFVQKAASSGMAEIAAGRLAASKGQSPAVQEFGRRMVADHTKANDELEIVAKTSGITPPSSSSPQQKATSGQLATLQGDAFDKAYAEQMVKDHQQAVELFGKEANAGSDAGLRSFAKKTLPELQQHLDMAKKLPHGAGAAHE